MSKPTPTSSHIWNFFRAGDLEQVRLQSGADLTHLGELDPKLWVSLGCPTKGLEFDSRTLELIDTDGDGRVRVPEVLAAVGWSLQRLKSPDTILAGDAPLALDEINTTESSGQLIHAAAKQILAALGKPTATSLTADDLADTTKILAQARFNGDGIVPAEAAADPTTRQAIADIIATMGGKTDRSGRPGVDEATANTFFADLQAWADWQAAADIGPGIRFLGDRTAAAFAALQAVRIKVDDYFNRCELAAFDSRAEQHLNQAETELAALAAGDLSVLGPKAAALPIAQVGPGRPLPLASGINPAWTSAVANLRNLVVAPVLGFARTSITREEWQEILSRFAPHAAWDATRPATPAAKLPGDRIRELLSGPARSEIGKLIAADLAVASEIEAIGAVERLVRYRRDLARLLVNFVNFADFYDPTRPATFQAGTLYLDSRHCNLCVPVADISAHAAIGSMSKCFLAYCELKRPGEAMKIVAVFSNGDSDFLMVGRNGMFIDRKGRDWDATIVKIVDNPISIRQAFWSPYKKFIRLLEEQINKRANSASAAADARIAGAAEAAATADKAAPSKPVEPKKFDLAVVTGIGVALGSIGTMLAAIFTRVLELTWWQYPIVLVSLMLAISLPSMLIAWLKLRQRTLGPILEANGWAINGRIKINIPLGTSFTSLARLPEGARRSLEDPFEDKAAARARRRALAWVAVLAIIGIGVWILVDRHQHAGRWLWEDRPAPAAPAQK
jgi:hypothetical protein